MWPQQEGREGRPGPAMQGRSQGAAGELGMRRWRRLFRRNREEWASLPDFYRASALAQHGTHIKQAAAWCST
jgi:hypothetical protein